MDVFEKALVFATQAHAGQLRKTGNIPSILHSAEVAVIAATLTDDREVLAAAVLHDTLEDTNVTMEDIQREFNDRVAYLVAGDTEDKHDEMPKEESWMIRKEESFRHLRNTNDRNVKILWLADKLSNIRSFHRLYLKEGEKMWKHFNQQDAELQKWYYTTVKELISDLSGTLAYHEYVFRLNEIFGKGIMKDENEF